VYEQKDKIIRLKTAGIKQALQLFETNLKEFEEHRKHAPENQTMMLPAGAAPR
jgi:hypothetical protein